MKLNPWGCRLAVAAVFLLQPVIAAAAARLELSPANYDFSHNAGGGTASAVFDVNVILPAGEMIAFYDFGLGYDPSLMTLASVSPFSGILGDPSTFDNDGFGFPEVDNFGYTDPTMHWNYQDTHPHYGAYNGPQLGTPVPTGGGWYEGSLRFSQLSNLGRDAATWFLDFNTDLSTLQDHAVETTYTLFTLTFDVDTTQHNASTNLVFIDDRDYADYPGPSSLLDVKLSTPSDPDAFDARYLPRDGATVHVPAPGSLLLMLGGLAGGVLARRRPSLAA